MRVYLFDDGVDLAPLTDLRASFQVRVGPMTLLEMLQDPAARPEGFDLGGLFAPAEKAGLLRESSGLEVGALRAAGQEPVLVLNGRCGTPDWRTLAALGIGSGLEEDGALVAACVPESKIAEVVRGGCGAVRTAQVSGPWLMRPPLECRDVPGQA